MKNVFKFLTLGMMSAALIGVTTVSSFAQDECEAIYKKYTDNFKGDKTNVDNDIAMKKVAIAGGEEFLSKCDNADNKEIADYLKKQVPSLKGKVDDIILYNRFNKSVPAKNYDEAFASGKEIVNKYPDTSLDVAIVLASIGFDNATGLANTAATKDPIDKYNNDTVAMANWVINHINNKSENYGAFGYEMKTKDYVDGKSNALGWMNYTIGYITYYRQKNPKGALPYLYKATQIKSYPQTIADLYRAIGSWYLDEFNRIGKERDDKTKAAGDKDTDETLALLALQKGYAERAMDAYYRAYKLSPKDPKAAQSYLDRAKIFYKARFELKPEAELKLDDFNKYTADMIAKPFPDPSSEVKPIVETPTADAATTPATGTSTAATTPAKTPATTTTTGAKTPATTPVKKPNPKK